MNEMSMQEQSEEFRRIIESLPPADVAKVLDLARKLTAERGQQNLMSQTKR